MKKTPTTAKRTLNNFPTAESLKNNFNYSYSGTFIPAAKRGRHERLFSPLAKNGAAQIIGGAARQALL